MRSRRTFSFYVCEFLFEFFSSRFVRHVLCVVRVCFFCLCLSLCLSATGGDAEERRSGKKTPQRSTVRKQNECNRCLFLFVCFLSRGGAVAPSGRNTTWQEIQM